MRAGSITEKYPLGFLEEILNKDGEGDGGMFVQARINFDDRKNTFRREPYGNGYTPVSKVMKEE